MRKIDIDTWNRKEHFEFFSKMDNPFLGITSNVNITRGYQFVKENNLSLYSFYLHKSMKAINAISELKLRIINEEIIEYDTIHAGGTILREDKTFGFILAKYDEDYVKFNENLQNEIKEVHETTGLRLNNDDLTLDLVRQTTIPWISFTHLLHPTYYKNGDSVPKISYGKIFEENGEKWLPVNIEAHHGLVDGYHIGQYFEKFQQYINE